MRASPVRGGLAITASVLICLNPNLLAQAVAPPLPGATNSSTNASAVIDLGGNKSVTATLNNGISDRIGLQPSQNVSVTVQFPSTEAGRAISVESLDGGKIPQTQKRLQIAADGTLRFTFQAGSTPGLSQVCLRSGTQEIGLQFWVINPQNSTAHPPLLTAPATQG